MPALLSLRRQKAPDGHSASGIQSRAGQDDGIVRAMEGRVTIKTYKGKTVADALAQVKKDLGRDAVILHTRTYKAGGFWGVGARTLHEITATTSMTVAGLSGRASHRTGKPTPAPAASERPSSREWFEPPESDRAAMTAAAPITTAATTYTAAPFIAPASAAQPGPAPGPAGAQLHDELAAIKRMVGQVLQSASGVRHVGVPEALFDCYLKLVQAEVATEVADEIVGAVRDELEPGELADSEVVRQAVLRRLAAYIPVAQVPGKLERAPDGRPLTIALVGPTGVGKTTTVAKLAATCKLRRNRRVGLITCDTYRIAAVEQLRTYANIIGLPLRVAMTPAEMARACDELSDCDIILIDTAGRSPRDDERLAELQRFIEAAAPHQIHLVLSGTSGEGALRSAAERFAALGPNHVIFTKLDEAVSFGTLIGIARRIEATLSYVTTGQEVPDQIEAGNADRLARLVLDGPTRLGGPHCTETAEPCVTGAEALRPGVCELTGESSQ